MDSGRAGSHVAPTSNSSTILRILGEVAHDDRDADSETLEELVRSREHVVAFDGLEGDDADVRAGDPAEAPIVTAPWWKPPSLEGLAGRSIAGTRSPSPSRTSATSAGRNSSAPIVSTIPRPSVRPPWWRRIRAIAQSQGCPQRARRPLRRIVRDDGTVHDDDRPVDAVSARELTGDPLVDRDHEVGAPGISPLERGEAATRRPGKAGCSPGLHEELMGVVHKRTADGIPGRVPPPATPSRSWPCQATS